MYSKREIRRRRKMQYSAARIAVRGTIAKIIIFILFLMVISIFGWKFSSKHSLTVNYAQKNVALQQDLKAHVYKLAHSIGDRNLNNYQNLMAAEDYITQQFLSYGYKVELQKFMVNGKQVANIIVTKMGSTKPNEVIVIGAHYDSCSSPGADANASGVAALLELAKKFENVSTPRTIKFVAFVNEEPPFYKTEEMGSRVFAQVAKKQNMDIKAFVSLDMLGIYSNQKFSQFYPPLFGFMFPNRANFIAVISNLQARPLVKRVAADFKKVSRFPIESLATSESVPGVTFSDHWSFLQEGYPAVMVTDTAFYRYYHHKGGDTFTRLDYPRMAEVVHGLMGVVGELAS